MVCFKVSLCKGPTMDLRQRLNFRVFTSDLNVKCKPLIGCIWNKSSVLHKIIFGGGGGENSCTTILPGPFRPFLLCTAPVVISQSLLTFHLWQQALGQCGHPVRMRCNSNWSCDEIIWLCGSRVEIHSVVYWPAKTQHKSRLCRNVMKLRLIHHQRANLLLITMALLYFQLDFPVQSYELLNANNTQVDLDCTRYL